jgi:hypothetical protein
VLRVDRMGWLRGAILLKFLDAVTLLLGDGNILAKATVAAGACGEHPLRIIGARVKVLDSIFVVT